MYAMQVALDFEQPLDISSKSIDSVRVKFQETSLLFDTEGQQLETGTQIKKRIPSQFKSESEAQFFNTISDALSTQ